MLTYWLINASSEMLLGQQQSKNLIYFSNYPAAFQVCVFSSLATLPGVNLPCLCCRYRKAHMILCLSIYYTASLVCLTVWYNSLCTSFDLWQFKDWSTNYPLKQEITWLHCGRHIRLISWCSLKMRWMSCQCLSSLCMMFVFSWSGL